MVLFRHRFDVGKPGSRRGQGFVRTGILKGQHVEISLLLPADTDGLGPIVCVAGGNGVVQGIGKEHAQVKIVDPAGLGQDQGHLRCDLLRQPQLLSQQNIHHRVAGLIGEGQGRRDGHQLFQVLPALLQLSALEQAVQDGQMIFDVVAKGFRLPVTCLGLRNINLLLMGRLGQRLQLRLGLKALAELAVSVQGTQQRRQAHDLQEQQRTVLADLLQRNDRGKKAVGGMENIELCGKEEQTRKQQKSDKRRLTVLCPCQEFQYSMVTTDAKSEEKGLCHYKQQIQQRASDKVRKKRRLHRVDDPEREL